MYMEIKRTHTELSFDSFQMMYNQSSTSSQKTRSRPTVSEKKKSSSVSQKKKPKAQPIIELGLYDSKVNENNINNFYNWSRRRLHNSEPTVFFNKKIRLPYLKKIAFESNRIDKNSRNDWYDLCSLFMDNLDIFFLDLAKSRQDNVHNRLWAPLIKGGHKPPTVHCHSVY